MGIEIERKFLVCDASWRTHIKQSQPMAQGYLAASPGTTVRVRVAGAEAFLTLKGPVKELARAEFEYAIPVEEAREMLALFCEGHRLEKIRHEVEVGEHLWEIDEFTGENQGLIVAEVELASADEVFVRPRWLGAEVSGMPRYYNSQLVVRPFACWSEAEQRGEVSWEE
ncbi:CYTH domain-containing protein [Bradymonadaceae bacterium TMQ3]|nr:CYTH domain-containing protein [Bradymonadaceae bacterium TMQ3]TXC78258.1 CYTH domain-containing protein [Bradymonadales bacterium TMQ1]